MTSSGGLSRKNQTAPQRKRFRLTGPSVKLDPTTHAVRQDLAAVSLAEQVFAPHYAQAVTYRTTEAVAVHEAPMSDSAERGRLPSGAVYNVLDLSGGWAWGHGADGTPIGYVLLAALQPE